MKIQLYVLKSQKFNKINLENRKVLLIFVKTNKKKIRMKNSKKRYNIFNVGIFIIIFICILGYLFLESPFRLVNANPELIQTVNYQVTRTYSTDWVTAYYYDITQTQPTDKVEFTVNTTLKNDYGDITFTDYCSDANVDSIKCARANQSWTIYNRLVELNKPCK